MKTEVKKLVESYLTEAKNDKFEVSENEITELRNKIKKRAKESLEKNKSTYDNIDEFEEVMAEIAIDQLLKDKLNLSKTRSVPSNIMKKYAPEIFKRLKIKHLYYNK